MQRQGSPHRPLSLFLKKAIRKTHRIAYRGLHTRSELRRLAHSPDALTRSVAAVIAATLEHNPSPEERHWMRRIEAVRQDLLNSDEETVKARSDETMSVSSACRASKREHWGYFLHRLIRTFEPSRCLELGTCVGMSGAYQAAALALNGKGHLVTLEGSAPSAATARSTFEKLGLENVRVVTGLFQDTLPGVLQAERPLDYAFIDGHHDEQATVAYFERLLPALSETALLVFDDVSWSGGMRRAWTAIAAHEQVRLAVDMISVGLCVVGAPPSEPARRFKLALW